jgi:hypothetical protein
MITEYRLVEDIDRSQGNVHSYLRLQNVTQTYYTPSVSGSIGFYRKPERLTDYRGFLSLYRQILWQCVQTGVSFHILSMSSFKSSFDASQPVRFELMSFNAPATLKRENMWSKAIYICTNIYHTHLCSYGR